MSFRYLTFLSLLFLLFSYSSAAQIRSKGQPVFRNSLFKSSIQNINMPRVEEAMQRPMAEPVVGHRLKRVKYAHRFQFSYSPDNSGRWDTLTDGRRVWRLQLSSPGAYSLGLVFTKYHLPKGAQLFLYNLSSERSLGAYTSLNNKSSGKLAIEPLEGDEITIEYIEPEEVEYPAQLEVGELLHDYLNVFGFLKSSSRKKSAGSCNVNVNCEAGAEWQMEKNAVCHILYSGFIGSGALINNTRNNGRPYFLTAHHTLGTQNLAENTIFYFNYESETCDGITGPKTQTISGANLRATTNKLDFSLVELSVVPPNEFNPYYAGWNREDLVPQNTTCIHHPAGDVKKISKDFDSPFTRTYIDKVYTFDKDTHWQILQWDLGTTEGGSSGSPLFDQNHRIIGDLTGGSADCDNPVDDYFAKFSASWANYSDPAQQLKAWLDPDNTGVLTLDGYREKTGLFADFVLGADELCIGELLAITDRSQGTPTEYFWEFGEDATPATAYGKEPPMVSYSQKGVKKIKLTIREGEKEDYVIRSVQILAPIIPDFTYQIEGVKLILTNSTEDVQTVSWDFGDSSTSEEMNPVHEYASEGNYYVQMSAENACGLESVSREISTSYQDLFTIYPNPSHGVLYLDLTRIFFKNGSWEIYDLEGALIQNGNLQENSGLQEFHMEGQSSGIYILRLYVDGVVLLRKIMIV